MVRHVVASMVFVLVSAEHSTPMVAQTSAEQEASIGDPQQLKGTILERMVREQPTYRGNGRRVKWEWWDGISRSYLFEKRAVLEEVETGQPYWLKTRWVLRNVKVSFQDIYRLGHGDDDKLVPILSYQAILRNAPSSTFEGLTL